MADKSMDDYELVDMLHEGSTWKSYMAWSKRYEKDVLVKVYQRSGIMSAEPLMKEAIRQAREKPQESAVLTDVIFQPGDASFHDTNFLVNFILEKKAKAISRDIIERDDGAGRYAVGLAGYQIVEVLEMSATKKIQVARNISSGQEVIIKSALKVLEIPEANNFIRETFIQAYVEHEQNCKILDICFTKSPGNLFDIHLVMERMQKDLFQDIRERMNEGYRRYSEVELLTILKDVIAGLTHAKSLHIAHRDIKPSNIFVGADGHVKLGDFGSTWKKALKTRTASAAGTDDYMSPEMRQTMSSPLSNVDPFVSDVFSLGVTLLHLALLRRPLDIDSKALDDIEQCLRQKIREIAYSEGLKSLLTEMVAIQPLLRIKLEVVHMKTEDLLSSSQENRKGAAKILQVQPIQVPTNPAKVQIVSSPQKPAIGVNPPFIPRIEEEKKTTTPKMCRLKSDKVRFFNFDGREWMNKVRLNSPISVDEGTFYILDNDMIYYFGNYNERFTGREAGVLKCHEGQYALKNLPNMSERRVNGGGMKYKSELFVFGGHDDYWRTIYWPDDAIYWTTNYYRKCHKSAEVLSLSGPTRWTALPNMSEGKLGVCPVLFREKFYLCGYKNIDVFDPRNHRFDPVLPLQMPEEDCTDRVACMFEGQLLIVTRAQLHRISLTSLPPTISTADHKYQDILPASLPVVSGEYLYWPTWYNCKRASLRQTGQIERI